LATPPNSRCLLILQVIGLLCNRVKCHFYQALDRFLAIFLRFKASKHNSRRTNSSGANWLRLSVYKLANSQVLLEAAVQNLRPVLKLASCGGLGRFHLFFCKLLY